jgi:hypothetical protein
MGHKNLLVTRTYLFLRSSFASTHAKRPPLRLRSDEPIGCSRAILRIPACKFKKLEGEQDIYSVRIGLDY